jgi:hypothetical protein
MDTDGLPQLNFSVKRLPSGERTLGFDLSSYSAGSQARLLDYLDSQQVPYWMTPAGHLELLRAYHPYEIEELVELFTTLLNE